MLSNALNFLSDKRRRFHRSDTMPAFKSIACPDGGSTPVEGSVPTIEQGNSKQQAKQQALQNSQIQPNQKGEERSTASHSGYVRPVTPGMKQSCGTKDNKSTTKDDFSDVFKPMNHTSHLSSSGSVMHQRPTFDMAPERRDFVNSMTTSTDSSSPTHVRLTKRLTAESFAQSECDLTRPTGSGRHICGERTRDSPSKLETLSLPLQSHIPLDSLSTDQLGGSYSLSPSPLSYGSSGSPNQPKDDDIRDAGQPDFRLQERNRHTGQKITFLRDEKQELLQALGGPPVTSKESSEFRQTQQQQQQQHVSNPKSSAFDVKKTGENKEFASYVNSARNRVAQIRAKAGGKSKLQRSNSSAQVLRHSRDPVTGNSDRIRATSTQREITIPVTTNTVEPEIHIREQSVDRKRRGRRRGKTWIDKAPRSRSVTSPFHKERSPCSYEPGKPNWDVLTELARRATAEQCCRICVSSTSDTQRGGGPRWSNASAVILDLPQHSHTTSALTDLGVGVPLQHLAVTQSRRNRYAVVRRLRRNNSSINWPADRLYPGIENDLHVPTSQTAGDLLLPSKDVLIEKSKRAQEQETQQLLGDLFVWIEQKDIDQIVEHHQKLIQLCDELTAQTDQKDRSELGLNPLDYAILVSSPQVIAFLIMLGFRPGAMLTVALDHGPSEMRVNDPMKFLLTRRVGDVEASISTVQVALDTAVARANAQMSAQKEGNSGDAEHALLDEAFSEVARREVELQRSTQMRDKLIDLRSAIDRYPPVPPSPSKVVLMVYSAQSLLIRISPPRPPRSISPETKRSTKTNEANEASDTTSCESSSSERVQKPFEGRKVVGFEPDDYGSLVIRYRIEWSLSPGFETKNTSSTTVIPPIRFSLIVPDSSSNKPSSSTRSYIRTGFYELDGFPTGQSVYVRVYAFNVRGWSEPCYSQPRCVAPSSWVDALPVSKENSDETGNEITLRYGTEMYTEKFQALKKLLDQQLLLWAYRQPSTGPSSETNVGAEDSAKRTRSPMIQRKRSFRFPFTTKGLKFIKQTKSGVYLAMVCHTTPGGSLSSSDREVLEKSQVILVDDALPMVCVTKDEPNIGAQLSADVNWFARLLAQPKFGTDLQLISDNLLRSTTPANLQFRFLLLTALQRMQMALGSYDVGILYPDWFTGRLVDCGVPNIPNDTGEPIFLTTVPGGNKVGDEGSDSVWNSSPVSQPDSGTKGAQGGLILVLVRYVQNANDVSCSAGLRWCSLYKFLRQNKLNLADFTTPAVVDLLQSPKISFNESDSATSRGLVLRSDQMYLSPEMHLLSNLDVLLYYSERRQHKLDPGLYVSLIQMHAHFDHQAKILAAKTPKIIHMLPVERVRRRTHVCKSEWSTLYSLLAATDPESVSSGSKSQFNVNEPYALRFCRKLYSAWMRLSRRLNYTDEESGEFRFYLPEVIQISPRHALILIFPKTDQVCLPPGKSSTPPPTNCSWIFMTYFERNLGMLYDPEFYKTASSFMSILEVLIPMSTLVQRQCITDAELNQCTERTSTLQSIYQQVDSTFQEKRWLSEVISAARDRKRPHTLTLLSRTLKAFVNAVIRRMDGGKYALRVVGDLTEVHLGRSEWKDVLYLGSENTLNEAIQLVERKATTNEVRNLLNVCHIATKSEPPSRELPPAASHDRQVSVIRVYAGYATGLGSGASVKVLISVRATARDIVEVVIAKLNRTLESKRQQLMRKQRTSSPAHTSIFEATDSNRFCLTVSLSNTERLIPDDVRPLLLKEPWRSGRLYVRLIHDLQQYISSNSPPRSYLTTDVRTMTNHGESAENMAFVLSSVKSDRVQCSRADNVFHMVNKTDPPVVYLDGRPVNYP